jgi:hypothetical protein
MLSPATLQLYMGPLTPVPATRIAIESLTSLSVTINDEGQSGFMLSFSLGANSPLETLFMLTGGSTIPILRVIIVMIFNGTPEVLMDGVVTKHQTVPGSDAAHTTLSLTGEDISVLMDKIDFSGFPFPATPAEGRVALMLLKYAVLGIVPLVIPSFMIDVPIPTSQIPTQKRTDLAYIRELADEVGYVFYLDPGPTPGVNMAYWGPRIKVGVPQPALNVNMDMHTNVESLTFAFNNSLSTTPSVYYYDEKTKITLQVPIPAITPLSPPLGLVPPISLSIGPVSDETAKQTLPKSMMLGMAKAAESAEAVTAHGELDVSRYGRILKARRLVGVRGAGMAYDGLYYVKSVTHKIKQGEYKQSFELSRNGLVSTLPMVPA